MMIINNNLGMKFYNINSGGCVNFWTLNTVLGIAFYVYFVHQTTIEFIQYNKGEPINYME